jgi:hypothetical protein
MEDSCQSYNEPFELSVLMRVRSNEPKGAHSEALIWRAKGKSRVLSAAQSSMIPVFSCKTGEKEMSRTTTLGTLLLFVITVVTPSALLAKTEATPAKAEKASSTAQDSKDKGSKKTSQVVIPVFSLDRPMLESPVVEDPFFGARGAETLRSLVTRLEKARDDDQVKAVIVLLGKGSMGAGQLEEVHRALRQIRDTGKPVYAHADSLTFGKLALLSAASRISVAPVGELFITGMYGSQPHIRGMLDKIHVTPDFITCGKYKSAGEMFMRTEPSPPRRSGCTTGCSIACLTRLLG